MQTLKTEPKTTMKETKLLQNLKKGKRGALEKTIRQYTNYVSVIVYHVVGNSISSEDREEVVADSFLALWRHAETLDVNKGSVQSYLAATARNLSLNKLRQRREAQPLAEDMLVLFGDGPADEAARNELTVALLQAVDTLPEPDREIFLRYYYRGEKVNEVAERLKVNPATVKTKLARGRQKLKAVLVERGYGDETLDF